MEHINSAQTNVAAYISARRGVVVREINELTARRKEIFKRIAALNMERTEINRREMEYAKELGFLDRITEVCGQAAEAAPDCADDVGQPRTDANPPETPTGVDEPQEAAPSGLYIPERGEVVYSLPAREQPKADTAPKAAQDRRKKVQLCGATVSERRIREGLSYKQLAALTGIRVTELHEIVDNNAPTNPYKAQRIAFALCCTVGNLMAPPSQPAAAETEKPTYSRIGV